MALTLHRGPFEKATYTIRELYNYTHHHDVFDNWLIMKAFKGLYPLFTKSLRPTSIRLLNTPQSRWTVQLLRGHAADPQGVKDRFLRGCYMLAAVGFEDGKIVVELYIGQAEDMSERFKDHVYKINGLHLQDKKIQYFHHRCRKLGVTEPLFIVLSTESTGDDLALMFQESVLIAMFGTWSAKDVPRHRISTWKAVRRMKINHEDEHLPDGWHGANREIPFKPTRGFNTSRYGP